MVVPIIVWTPEVRLLAETLDVGTPVTVLGRTRRAVDGPRRPDEDVRGDRRGT